MSLFSRAGSPFPEPILSPFPGFSLFGGSTGTISTDAALRLDAVWACVRLLADSVSMMPLRAYTTKQGVRVPISDPPLLVHPSADASMPDWIYMVMVSLLLRGNAYGRIVARDFHNYPTQIELLDPDRVSPRINAEGEVVYWVDGKEVDAVNVWHVRAFRMPGSPLGLSPIAYGARALNTAGAAEEFGHGFFRDGAHPSAILTTTQPVNQDQARTIKDRFLGAVKGREPAVLGAGLAYTAIQVSPEESQFLETQKLGVSKIARMFGVPPEMIGGEAGGSMTYANVTQRSLDFLTYSVQPWLNRLEAALFPLIPGARHVLFDTSALVRMTATDRWNVNKVRLETKAVTINEVRNEEGQPPVPWGDKPVAATPKPMPPTGAPEPDADDTPEGSPA